MRRIFLVLVTCLILAGCSNGGSQKDSLVGTWVSDKKMDTKISISKDGSMAFYDHINSKTTDKLADWTLDEKSNILKVHTRHPETLSDIKVDFLGKDQIKLYGPDGRNSVLFEREKE